MKHRWLGPWRASFDSCTNAGRQPHDLVFGQYEVSQSLRYFRPHPV